MVLWSGLVNNRLSFIALSFIALKFYKDLPLNLRNGKNYITISASIFLFILAQKHTCTKSTIPSIKNGAKDQKLANNFGVAVKINGFFNVIFGLFGLSAFKINDS